MLTNAATFAANYAESQRKIMVMTGIIGTLLGLTLAGVAITWFVIGKLTDKIATNEVLIHKLMENI